MSDHLPECPCNHADERGCFLISAETNRCVDCICPQLRACEQRVLDAAREAVAALFPQERYPDEHAAILDAIDALREDEK